MMDSYSNFCEHTSILVGDDVYIWGGDRLDRYGLPKVLDSPEKRQFLSSVFVFNILDAIIVERPTTGTPPNGAIGYGSCCVGDNIYYFGGQCGFTDSYHNDLFVLNTTSNKWNQIICNNGPMKKSGSRMIPFSINGDDYILVMGGHGPLPPNPPSHAQYNIPYSSSRCYTNEVHIMCVSTTPGKWTVPMRTGSVFPPSYGFSINTLPGNRAIVFGGWCVNEPNEDSYSSCAVFIVSYTNKTIDFQRLDHSATNVLRPEGRCFHSSVVISSVSGNGEQKHYLLVLGGWALTPDFKTTADCWLLDITSGHNQWKQISLPKEVTNRNSHSISCYNMSDHCKWLIVSGGRNIRSPNRLMIVELVFSPTDDNWTVTNVLNEEDMKNTTNYIKLLPDRLSKVQFMKQQLKQREQEMVSELSLVQRRLEDERRAHDITRQQMDEKERKLREKDDTVQHKNEALRLKDVQLQEKDEIVQRNRKEIQRKDASIQQQQRRISEDIKKFKLLQKEKDSLTQQKKAMVREIEQSRKETETLQQEMKGKVNEITTLDQKYKKLKQDETALQTKLDGKERELNAVKTRIDDEIKRYKLLQIEKDTVSQEMKDRLREKDKILQQHCEAIQQKDASIEQQQTKIDEDIKKFKLLQGEKDSLSHQKKAMAREVEQSRKETEKLQQEMKEKINEITKQQDQKYRRLKQDETTLQTKLDGKERELNALKMRIDDDINRYKLLQMEKDALSQEMKDMAYRLKVDDLCDVMLSIAYIQTQWEELGRVLRVPSNELQRIAAKRNCTVTRRLYDTLRYWIVRVGGSWKGLVNALKHKDIGQQELADTINHDHAKTKKRQTVLLKDHKLISQYNDLSPYDIFSHVDWMVLGAILGLDDDTLEQIETNHSTDDTRARVMMDRWISTGQAYWSILVDALDSPIFGETELANRIAKNEMGINIQTHAGGTDDGILTEGTAYEIDEATVEEMKKQILQKLTNAASTLKRQPRGIIYAFAMTDVMGARVDLITITNTFEKDLKFAVYPVEDIDGAKLANLIKAAATFDYSKFSITCKHVCFHFAGHGGIREKRPFFKLVANGGERFFIHENILTHFGRKSRPKDRFIFFFDCCLSQSPDDQTQSEVGFSVEVPFRCLIAYATSVGVTSYGDKEKGGRWTSTLCEHLKEQVELGEALAKTHDVVLELSDSKQPSHFRSCIGPVYLKGMPEKQASAATDEEESKNILRRHRSELLEALCNNPIDLTRLATALSMDGIINPVLEDEVVRCKGNKKEVVGKFLNELELKADKQPMCLPRLFKKMDHFDGTLRAIAQVLIEEATNDKDLAITTDLYEDLNKCKADLDKCKADLDNCKAENEDLKQKLERALSDREQKKQVTNHKDAYTNWKDKMTTVIEDVNKK